MFFHNHKNLENLGMNKEAVVKLRDGKIKKEVVEIIMEKLISLYGGDKIISDFLDFVKKHRNDGFLYLENLGWRRPRTRQSNTFPSRQGCLNISSRQKKAR